MKSVNDIIDPLILSTVTECSGKKLFDYGCGHTDLTQKIASLNYQVTAFDIDDKVIAIQKEKENPYNIEFLDFKEFAVRKTEMRGAFDIILSSLVLCVIEDQEEIDELMDNINFLTKPNGCLISAICNPLSIFKDSSIQKKIIPANVSYQDHFRYSKIINSTGRERPDFHRPMKYYETLFSNHGFRIIDIKQSIGKNQNDEITSDFIVFKCRKE